MASNELISRPIVLTSKSHYFTVSPFCCARPDFPAPVWRRDLRDKAGIVEDSEKTRLEDYFLADLRLRTM